jgi:hypothetical protein
MVPLWCDDVEMHAPSELPQTTRGPPVLTERQTVCWLMRRGKHSISAISDRLQVPQRRVRHARAEGVRGLAFA